MATGGRKDKRARVKADRADAHKNYFWFRNAEAFMKLLGKGEKWVVA